MSVYLSVWSSVPPTLCVLINVTLTRTTRFGSWQSCLMPAWFSTLSISERAWRKAHSIALAYGLYSLIVSLIYICTTGTYRACWVCVVVRTSILCAFESFSHSKMCDQSQKEACFRSVKVQAVCHLSFIPSNKTCSAELNIFWDLRK